MARVPSKSCIVCGRPVKRITHDIEVQPVSPQERYHQIREASVVADLRTKADCQRHTNQPFVVSIVRGPAGFVRRFTVWDGTSYYHSGFFCTGNCAQKQGYASATHGYRFTWGGN